jgi:hypothetical protein
MLSINFEESINNNINNIKFIASKYSDSIKVATEFITGITDGRMTSSLFRDYLSYKESSLDKKKAKIKIDTTKNDEIKGILLNELGTLQVENTTNDYYTYTYDAGNFDDSLNCNRIAEHLLAGSIFGNTKSTAPINYVSYDTNIQDNIIDLIKNEKLLIFEQMNYNKPERFTYNTVDEDGYCKMPFMTGDILLFKIKFDFPDIKKSDGSSVVIVDNDETTQNDDIGEIIYNLYTTKYLSNLSKTEYNTIVYKIVLQ